MGRMRKSTLLPKRRIISFGASFLLGCSHRPLPSRAPSVQPLVQYVQQGDKLVGSGASGIPVHQGWSSALSADGNTALVGGPLDNRQTGAAWVYTRSNSVWSQQGGKLLASDTAGPYPGQGSSVALSSDGNTAVVGGNLDDQQVGAAWVFMRAEGTWHQQGPKLVGKGAVGTAAQGGCVALSGDGNTAIVGGPFDKGMVGAVWVFVRTADAWMQQGSKLVGSDAVGASFQCQAALSADGNTAIVGGLGDNSHVGAAWVFVHSGAVWRQQGDKLVGTGRVDLYSEQGNSVALSADGNTALVGGDRDNDFGGAAWVFVRAHDAWREQGDKLVRNDTVGKASQACSVALAGDGNTAILGGYFDNAGEGGAWIFRRSGGAWTTQGDKLIGTGALGKAAQGYSVALSSDGTTVLLGGTYEGNQVGAVWPFFMAQLRR